MIPLLIAAQIACLPIADILDTAADRYGETIVATDYDGTRIAVLLANPETTTWTMLGTISGETRACVLGAGKGWAPKDEGRPA